MEEMPEGGEGNETHCGDEFLLSSFWRKRFEQIEAEASRVSAELQRERNQRALLEEQAIKVKEAEAARVRLLEQELSEAAIKWESEMKQRAKLEELLRTKESTSSLANNKKCTHAYDSNGMHLSHFSLPTASRPSPDDGLIAQTPNRAFPHKPRSVSFIDNKHIRDSAGRVTGATLMEGVSFDQKVAMDNRSRNRHSSRGGSGLDRKVAVDDRSRKRNTTRRGRGVLQQKIAIDHRSRNRARPNPAPNPSHTRVALEFGPLLNSPTVDPPISVMDPINEGQDSYRSRSEEEATVQHPNMESEQPLVARLVHESSTLPSTVATVINTKRRSIMNGIKALVLATVVAIITGITVRYTRQDRKLGIHTSSPTSSQEPSMSPSSFPSASPSTGLFGFLVQHSFDNGAALMTAGSAQQKAMDWLLNISAFSTLNYDLLQQYVLATLYHSTSGNQWTITEYYQRQRLSGNLYLVDLSQDWLNNTDFCNWQGVLCDQLGEMTSLQLRSNRLFGSIPAELAFLDQSLSKIPDMKLLFCHDESAHVCCSFLVCRNS